MVSVYTLAAVRALTLIFLLVSPVLGQSQSNSSPEQTSTNRLVVESPQSGTVLSEQHGTPHPQDEDDLQVALARKYLANGDEKGAIATLRDLLRRNPSNRDAKIELARILGYRAHYKASNQLYRDLLSANPDDEAASLGLIHNLIQERRLAEARLALREAFFRHPNSLLLQEYNDRWGERQTRTQETRGGQAGNRIEVAESYFADSAGNRSLRSTQAVQHKFSRFLTNRWGAEERSIWKSGGPRANVVSGSDDLRLPLLKFLAILAGGGVVRFADERTRSLYNGDVELRPYSRLSLVGGYSRSPILPTFDSAQFDLLASGWHTRLDWHPKSFRFSGTFSQHRYTDGNRVERERAELIHWTGSSWFAFGTGYEFSHIHFLADLNHGYFSPNQYRSHLAEVGLRFRVGKVFRAEYLGRGGVESVSNGSFTPAGELLLQNRFLIKRWEAGVDYGRLQVAQSTGAFQANSASISLGYHF